IAVVVSALGPFFIPEASADLQLMTIPYEPTYVDYGFMGLAILTLIDIFLFKNRQRQMIVARLLIFLNIILLGFFVYWFLTLPGEIFFSEKGIGSIVPIVSIVFLGLAHRAIKKDENLVKSVDRLR